MRKVFTPHNRFQQTACYRGRCFSARQPDGVHLSNAGARVAADIIARRLRADRAIR
jgi:lysophospholipase L1-like esterase